METQLAVYPPDWDDDERMSFLFSAFKQNRDVNSSDWDSKMNFWTPLILKHAKTKQYLSVTLRQLQADFTRKGSVPLGLGIVIQEMIRHGSLQREQDFVSGAVQGWLAWSMRQLVIKPLHWTVGAVLGCQISPDEVFLVPDVIKGLAVLVLQRYQTSHLHAVTLLCEEEVQSLCIDLCPKPSELNLVLLQLQREKKICLFEKAGKKLIKFVQNGACQVTPVSESDLGIYDLQQSEKLLSERLQSMCGESDRLKEEARTCSQNGNKQQALRHMRRRKLKERHISDLQSKLDNVHNILERISAAETDRKVISAYQTGVSALRLALKDVNLEKAESLVDQIQEFCDLQDDLSQTLSGPAANNDNLDSDELERELDEILQRDIKEMQFDLPDVPKSPLFPISELRIEGLTGRDVSPEAQHSRWDHRPVLETALH